MSKSYWLLKTEPGNYSIDDLKRDRVTHWHGVRNYQARNFLRAMKKGDEALIYHSVTAPIGVVGLAKIVKEAYSDPSQFDPQSQYFDPKATAKDPRWFCPDLRFVKKFKAPLGLADLRGQKALARLELLRRGSRLSVQPLRPEEFRTVLEMV